MIEASPLQDYCEKIDLKYYEKTYGWYYYELALDRVPTNFITNLVIEDFRWRALHQQNIIASTEGEQGCGKSLFTINLCIHAGNLFSNAFILERDIYTNPYELDNDLRSNLDRRRTFMYDEQPQRMVGMGSHSTKISLKDYEEIGRYTQKNIFYCSPELIEHSHYFVFKQVDYQLNRLKNKACEGCEKYVPCHFKKYETLCDIPFYEREGYPKEFRFMLYTKRLSDQILMPRGIVSFPMVAPQTAKAYDNIKDKNIIDFENFENNAWDRKTKIIEEFVKENFEELTKETERGLKPVSKDLIYAKFFSKFGTNRFLKDEVALFVAMAKDLIEKRINGKD